MGQNYKQNKTKLTDPEVDPVRLKRLGFYTNVFFQYESVIYL